MITFARRMQTELSELSMLVLHSSMDIFTQGRMELPSGFKQYTQQLFGDELYQRFIDGMDAVPPTSVRLNPVKCVSMGVVDEIVESKVPWCNHGCYLKKRQPFTFDPMLHAGLYYVQDAASMAVSLPLIPLLNEKVLERESSSCDSSSFAEMGKTEKKLVLDLCAAPGGKSTALRAALPDDWLLMSNEPVRQRAQILSENLQKWGNPHIIVTNNYPKDYRKSGLMFDLILCDVPCSGEGMFRKDESAIDEWSAQKVENCWRLQREIVTDAWECLHAGGFLIYSTCTYNTREDEENVRWMVEELGAEIVEIPFITSEEKDNVHSLDGEAGNAAIGSLLVGFNEPVYRFISGVTKSEGLFMAVLRKKGIPSNTSYKRGDKNHATKRKDEKSVIEKVLSIDAFPVEENERDSSLHAIPTPWLGIYMQAAKKLNIIHAGVKIGTWKGKDIVPDQSLALSTALKRGAFPEVSVDYRQAISYLSKDAIPLPPDTPRGFVLLTYKGIPLGFEKNLGNRANNLYPQEWRIKSKHVPENGCCVMEPK